jgi:hypothetical protein
MLARPPERPEEQWWSEERPERELRQVRRQHAGRKQASGEWRFGLTKRFQQ